MVRAYTRGDQIIEEHPFAAAQNMAFGLSMQPVGCCAVFDVLNGTGGPSPPTSTKRRQGTCGRMFLVSLPREKSLVTRWARRTVRHVGRSSGCVDAYRACVTTPEKVKNLLPNRSVSIKLVWIEFNVNRQTYPGKIRSKHLVHQVRCNDICVAMKILRPGCYWKNPVGKNHAKGVRRIVKAAARAAIIKVHGWPFGGELKHIQFLHGHTSIQPDHIAADYYSATANLVFAHNGVACDID
jgi:hypothetical protein